MRIIAGIAGGLIVLCAASAASYDDFARGLTANQQRSSDLAISAFSAAIAAGDLNASILPQAYRGRAEAYLRKKQCPEALSDIDTAIKLDGNSWEALEVRADVEVCLDNATAADEAFTAAIARRELPALYWYRGHFRLLQKNYSGAIADFTRQATLDQYAYYGRLWLELTHLRAGADPKLARQDIGYLETKYWPGPLLELYAGSKTPEQVLDVVNDGRGNTGAKQCDADFFIGAWWLGHADTASAKPLLEKVIKDCPADSIAFSDAQNELKQLK